MALVLLGSLVAGCTAQPAEVIKIETNTFVPPQSKMVGFCPVIIDRLNQVCEGQVIWENLGGPEIVTGLDQFDAVQSGVMGGAFTVAGYYTSDVPAAYATSLSQITPWEERENGFFDLIVKEHEKQGVRPLGRFIKIGQYLQFVKPVASIADMQGKKMRASGNQLPPWLEALGMVPVETPIPETYTALERGIVDGMAFPVIGVTEMGMYEVIKYVVDHPAFAAQNGYLIVNLDLWNKIPKRLQNKIDDTMAELEHEMWTYFDGIRDQERQRVQDQGVTFVKFSPAEGKQVVDAAYNSGWEFQKSIVSPEMYQKLRELTGY